MNLSFMALGGVGGWLALGTIAIITKQRVLKDLAIFAAVIIPGVLAVLAAIQAA